MSLTALQQAKATLRKELKQRLAAMTDQERQRQSDVIAERVCNIKENYLIVFTKPDRKTVDLFQCLTSRPKGSYRFCKGWN